MLVRPAEGWTHWDDGAARVHGITREVLHSNGKAVHEVAMLLNQDLAGLTVYCDGWAHDYTWLAILFEEAGLAPNFRLESVNRLLRETQLGQLDDARRGALSDMGLTRHRASNDARALQTAIQRVAA
jgi:DNA polymerase III epsilon subunit-like protein